MWIRSQDGKRLVKCENIGITDDGLEIFCETDDMFMILGEYDCPKCTKQELDNIERHLTSMLDERTIKSVYHMSDKGWSLSYDCERMDDTYGF